MTSENPALSAARARVAQRPDDAQAHNELGMLLGDAGDFAAAAAAFRRAVAIEHRFPHALHNLGMALMEIGDVEQAVASFREVLALTPQVAMVHVDLGDALLWLGQAAEAEAIYLRAAELDPASGAAHLGIGNARRKLGRLVEAEQSYRTALELGPRVVIAHCLLGITLFEQHRVAEAERCYVKAIEIDPASFLAHADYGYLLLRSGRLEEAERALERSVALRPEARAMSNLLLVLNYFPGRRAEEIDAKHRDYGRRFAFGGPVGPHPNSPQLERRLRIGYVSGDFCNHSVANFIEPVLATHDRRQVQVFCYDNHPTADEVAKRLRSFAATWREVAALSDQALAERIRADEIDILIDLTGHTGYNRLATFARKPAPVQATWLGYPTVTGLQAIDYRITDACVDEPQSPRRDSERPARLAASYFCFGAPHDAGEPGALPAAASGEVTFASFNSIMKLNDSTVALWSRVLREIPRARLLLKSAPLADPLLSARWQKQFARHGVDADRLVLRSWTTTIGEHLTQYREVDIALDTFPYNGATTTCEALWMGVPVVSLCGETHASRMGKSILSAAGLSELLCRGEEEFVAKCVALARDLPSLAALRAKLRGQVRSSPLMDAPRFTRNLEELYRTMWRDWCVRK